MSPKQKKWSLALLVACVSFAAAWGLARSEPGRGLEDRTYDWRWQHSPPVDPPAHAALVLIDESTLHDFAQAFKIRWPFPRDLYCPVLAWLQKAGARAVVFDIGFFEPDEQDPTLAQCFAASPPVWLAWSCDPQGQAVDPPQSVTGQGALPGDSGACARLLPVPELAQAAKGVGRIDLQPDADGVMRRMHPVSAWKSGQWLPMLGWSPLAQHAGVWQWQAQHYQVHGVDVPSDSQGAVVLPWRTTGWPTLSFGDVFRAGQSLAPDASAMAKTGPRPNPLIVRDRVVFIGASGTALFDLKTTPLQTAVPGVEGHAALYEAGVTGRVPHKPLRLWMNLLLALLCLATAAAATALTRPWVQALAAGLLMVGHAGAAAWYFHTDLLWLPMVAPTAGIAFAYALGTAINYQLEGRARQQIRNAFSHYLAPAVIEQLVRDPSRLQLGGERRDITAFFSDIAGFTSISEQLDPGALVALLNECLGAMTEIILEEGGTIDKYIGDAIVAMFGAPLDQPDHALRACRAALRCQKRLEELRIQWKIKGLPELHMRIGLNAGQALVGNMGSKHRFDFTMMGDTVNLASRLESAAGNYHIGILAGENVAQRLNNALPLREVDLLRVKGKMLGVRVLEVREHPAATDVEMAHAIELFRARQWQQASQAAQGILALTPGDGPAQTLLDHATFFARKPPPADWDGAWTLTGK